MTSPTERNCKLNDALVELARASLKGEPPAVDKALSGFQSAVACISREGAAHQYGPRTYPRPSELSTFELTLERLRKIREK
jgi:hypothetical protein